MHIQDAANPGRYLEVRGDARIEPDDDYAFADRVGAKYGGVDLRAMDAGNGRRVVVTVEPVHASTPSTSAEAEVRGDVVDGPEDVVDRHGVVATLRRHVEAREHDQPVDPELAVAVDELAVEPARR